MERARLDALPPGPRAPAALNMLRFMRAPIATLRSWQARYGNVFTVRFAGFGTGVYVAEPDAVRELFTGDQSDLLAGEANSFMTPVLGPSSVIVLDGRAHLRQRKLLLPPFQGSRVADFREVIGDVAAREVATWTPGRSMKMRERMRAVTFEVICRAVFGVTDLGPLSPGRRFQRRLAAADAALVEEIERRRGEADLAERSDVLSLLLRARDEDGRPMSTRELRDELITMLSAGHETTATGLTFAFELLSRNPAALERLRDELRAGADDAYLDAVVKETLRLRPIIDAAERTLTQPREVAGWMLPAGVKVYPGILLMHMRGDLYPEPERFLPERFLDEAAESYTWLPFGGGIRRCIGAALAQAEMSEVLRAVVTKVELRPLRDEPEPVVLRGITLAPKHGGEMTVRRRLDGPAPAKAAVGAAAGS
jgi:cytochrome P450